MTPAILALIVLGLVVVDIVFNLLLFGTSVALAVLVTGIMTFYGMTFEYWQWSIIFVVLTVIFILLTRLFVKKNDYKDINHYERKGK